MNCFKRKRFFSAPCYLILVATLLSGPIDKVAGQTFTGGGDGFSWNDGSNWDGGSVPGSGDDNPFVEITDQTDVQINVPTTLGTTSGSEELSVNFTDSVLSVNAPSQLDAAIGVDWLRSTLNVNADLNSRATMNGGVLNLNSGVLSGTLSLGSADPAGGGGFPPFPFPPFGGGGDSGPAVVNRNGGTLNLESLSVSGGDAAPGVIDLTGSDTVGEATAGDNGVLNVNGAAITSGVNANAGGTANINSGTVSGVHDINGGTLGLNGGALTGELRLSNFGQDSNPSGADPTFTRSGGTLDLLTLDATGNVAIDINAGDNVSGGIQTREGAQVTINSDQALERLVNSNNGFTNGSLIAEQGSTVFLNADILDSELVQYQGDSLQRAAGVSIQTQTLNVSSADYTYDGTDSINGSINITDGDLDVTTEFVTPSSQGVTVNANRATVSINAELTPGVLGSLSGTGQSTININQATNASFVVSVGGGSVLNVNADLQAGNANGTTVRGGTVNLNNSTLRGRLQLLDGTAGEASVFNRDGGATLELFGLRIEDGNHLDVLNGDSISNDISLQEGSSLDVFTSLELNSFASLAGGSTLNVFQSDGELTGFAAQQLELDDSSTLNLNFDDFLAAEDELDFGLRLTGDVVDELEAFIANGQLTFTGPESASIGVIRDVSSFGDFTYVGYIGVSAVPEPNGLMLLGIVSLAGMINRRRS